MSSEPERVSFQLCEACGGEGYEGRVVTVYEQGCGFGHDDYELDYSRPCKWCERGIALIPVEPIEFEDLDLLAARRP